MTNRANKSQVINPLATEGEIIDINESAMEAENFGADVSQTEMMEANELLSRPQVSEPAPEPAPNPQVDLAKAALEVQSNSLVQEEFRNPSSTSIANQDISWYNQGVALIEAGKYAEALSCFDRALPSFSDDDEMVIRILNRAWKRILLLGKLSSVCPNPIIEPC